MKVITATIDYLPLLTPLMDGYRVFYKQQSNPGACREFLKERLENEDSVIFIAISEVNEALGFTQLYPSFSTVSMQRVYILNDLFVDDGQRGKGVGQMLLEHAKDFAKKNGSKGLTLETGTENPAQFLYERLGWVKDSDVFHYTWKV